MIGQLALASRPCLANCVESPSHTFTSELPHLLNER